MDNICAVIPARYGSKRLPGKPLLEINGRTIISMTYQQTCKSKYISKVFVATDDERIKEEIEGIGGSVIMIKEECLNGTERICRCLEHLDKKYDLIVNVQGDEPYVSPKVIDYMIEKHLVNRSNDVVCTTIHTKIKNTKYLKERSFGKMVIDQHNHVLYCSRNIIPGTKGGEVNANIDYLTHVGIFVFERDFLYKYMESENTPLQISEDIEWLKIIEMGYRIKSYEIEEEYEIGVNTTEDYEYLKNKYTKHQI